MANTNSSGSMQFWEGVPFSGVWRSGWIDGGMRAWRDALPHASLPTINASGTALATALASTSALPAFDGIATGIALTSVVPGLTASATALASTSALPAFDGIATGIALTSFVSGVTASATGVAVTAWLSAVIASATGVASTVTILAVYANANAAASALGIGQEIDGYAPFWLVECDGAKWIVEAGGNSFFVTT